MDTFEYIQISQVHLFRLFDDEKGFKFDTHHSPIIMKGFVVFKKKKKK